MSEQIYTVTNLDGEEVYLTFSDMDETYRCLCSFPMNDAASSIGIDRDRVRSLALLGAAVVLAHYKESEPDYNYLPSCVPEWIRSGIDKAIGYNE